MAKKPATSSNVRARMAKQPRVVENLGLAGKARDQFSNLLAGLGVGTPSMINGTYYGNITRFTLDYLQITGMYRNSWLARKVVEGYPDAMTKEWARVECEVEPKQLEKLDDVLDATATRERVFDGLVDGYLYGGAISVIVIDGQDPADPLDLDSIAPGSYKGLIHLDRWLGVTPSSEMVTSMSNLWDYGLPEKYYVRIDNASQVTVHHSRVLRWTGRKLPLVEAQGNQMWGMSELEHVLREIQKKDNASEAIINTMFRAAVFAYRDSQLAAMQSSIGAGGAALANYESRVQAINQMLTSWGMLVVPNDGGMDIQSLPMSGYADVYEIFKDDTCAAAEYPKSIIYGKQSGGLSDEFTGDLQVWESRVKQRQQRYLWPQLTKLYRIIMLSTLGTIPDRWKLEFPPIRQMTSREKSELASANTNTVLSAYNAGLISQRTALLELKEQSEATGVFTNITDDDVQAALNQTINPFGEEEHNTQEIGDSAQFNEEEHDRDESGKFTSNGEEGWADGKMPIREVKAVRVPANRYLTSHDKKVVVAMFKAGVSDAKAGRATYRIRKSGAAYTVRREAYTYNDYGKRVEDNTTTPFEVS